MPYFSSVSKINFSVNIDLSVLGPKSQFLFILHLVSIRICAERRQKNKIHLMHFFLPFAFSSEIQFLSKQQIPNFLLSSFIQQYILRRWRNRVTLKRSQNTNLSTVRNSSSKRWWGNHFQVDKRFKCLTFRR